MSHSRQADEIRARTAIVERLKAGRITASDPTMRHLFITYVEAREAARAPDPIVRAVLADLVDDGIIEWRNDGTIVKPPTTRPPHFDWHDPGRARVRGSSSTLEL